MSRASSRMFVPCPMDVSRSLGCPRDISGLKALGVSGVFCRLFFRFNKVGLCRLLMLESKVKVGYQRLYEDCEVLRRKREWYPRRLTAKHEGFLAIFSSAELGRQTYQPSTDYMGKIPSASTGSGFSSRDLEEHQSDFLLATCPQN